MGLWRGKMGDGGRRDECLGRPQTGGRIRYVCSCEVPERELSEPRNIGLDGTILPGVTRASCLTLPISTRRSGRRCIPPNAGSMADLDGWDADGTLLEVFCVGTAVIVAAIHRIGFEGRNMHSPKYPSVENGLGPVGRALRAKYWRCRRGGRSIRGGSCVSER